MGYSPRGRKESDMTERLHFHFHFYSQRPEQKSRVHSPVLSDGEGDSLSSHIVTSPFAKYLSHRDFFFKISLVLFINY